MEKGISSMTPVVKTPPLSWQSPKTTRSEMSPQSVFGTTMQDGFLKVNRSPKRQITQRVHQNHPCVMRHAWLNQSAGRPSKKRRRLVLDDDSAESKKQQGAADQVQTTLQDGWDRINLEKLKTRAQQMGLYQDAWHEKVPRRSQSEWLNSDYRDAYIGTYTATLHALSKQTAIDSNPAFSISYQTARQLCMKYQEYNLDFPLRAYASRIACDAGLDAFRYCVENQKALEPPM